VIFYGNFLMQAHLVDLLVSRGGYGDDRTSSLNFVAQTGLVCNAMFWLGGLCSVQRLRVTSALALQLQGFGLAAAMFFAVALAKALLAQARWRIHVAFYALSLLAPGFGPAPTTFLMPALLFPPELRSTANGIAAASGKMGAAVCVGMVLLEGVDLANLMALYGSTALLGAGTTMGLMKGHMQAMGRNGQGGGFEPGRGHGLGRGRGKGGAGGVSGASGWNPRTQDDEDEGEDEGEDEDRRLLRQG